MLFRRKSFCERFLCNIYIEIYKSEYIYNPHGFLARYKSGRLLVFYNDRINMSDRQFSRPWFSESQIIRDPVSIRSCHTIIVVLDRISIYYRSCQVCNGNPLKQDNTESNYSINKAIERENKRSRETHSSFRSYLLIGIGWRVVRDSIVGDSRPFEQNRCRRLVLISLWHPFTFCNSSAPLSKQTTWYFPTNRHTATLVSFRTLLPLLKRTCRNLPLRRGKTINGM